MRPRCGAPAGPPRTSNSIDGVYASADRIVENALPAAVDLDEPGAVGADSFDCPVCVDWLPFGRETKLPPNPRGARVWRVTVLLRDAMAGRGPGIAEVWFSSTDAGALA